MQTLVNLSEVFCKQAFTVGVELGLVRLTRPNVRATPCFLGTLRAVRPHTMLISYKTDPRLHDNEIVVFYGCWSACRRSESTLCYRGERSISNRGCCSTSCSRPRQSAMMIYPNEKRPLHRATRRLTPLYLSPAGCVSFLRGLRTRAARRTWG